KEQYINLLRQIHILAKYSQSIGGGEFFETEREVSALELEDAGVIVDPIKVKVNNEGDPWENADAEESKVINNRSKNLAQEYKKYLQSISQKTTSDRSVISQVIARDFAGSNPSGQKELLTFIKQNFNAKAKAYRAAVKSGQLELAKEQGEELIRLAASVKSLYGELADFDELDPEVQSSFKSYKSYVSSVETEVLAGAGAKGRANQGLPDLFEQQLNLSEDDGQNVAEGFIEGILENLIDARDAGEQLIEAVEEGIRDAGEIQSPSKLAARLGRWFVQGFGLGMSGEDLEDRGRDLVESATDGIRNPGMIGFNIFSQIKSQLSELEAKYPVLFKYKNLLKGIAVLFLGGMGISFVIGALARFGKSALDTAMSVESLNKAIVFSSRDFATGVDNLNFISETAKKLNIDLNNAKGAYAGLLGAAKDTPLEGEQTQRIFTAFAEASANRGVNVEGQQRLFTALGQIIGKRQLGAEEVKGQIGDIQGFGDFQNLIAEAMGISTPQLTDLMQKGAVKIDVLPKVAALLEAQNAASDGTQTALQAQTKYNNSLIEFQTALGKALQPLQKLSFNVLSQGLDLVTQKFGGLSKIILNLAGVGVLALFGQVNLLKLAFVGLGNTLNGLILVFSRLWAAKLTIITQALSLAGAYALVAVAIASLSNVINLSKNQYQYLNDDVEKLTAGMNRYKEAIKEATTAQKDFAGTKVEKPQLNEGWQLPDNKFGNFLRPIVGGDRLNFDNVIRNRWNGMLDRMDAYNYAASGGTAPLIKGKTLTEAERRQADFQAGLGDVSFQNNQLLLESQPAINAATEITKYDAQIAEIQSHRLELLPSDQQALKDSLSSERKINTARDKQLKILTEYQQSLQLGQSGNKKDLEDLELGYSEKKFSTDVYNSTKADILSRQSAAADKLKLLGDILSNVTKTLSQFQRELRNSSERINNFIARRGLEAQQERTKINTEGVEERKGDRVIQLELDAASRSELDDYITELEGTIQETQKRLNSGALAEGYRLVEQSASDNNLTLDSATVERMLAEEERSQGEKDALGELKSLLDNQSRLAGYQEQLAQNILSNRNALIDFNRTISDYFFKINQQIKEAQIEVLRIVNQIIQTNIKNKLQAAISPNAESFVNNLISSTQSLLDQTASYAEKVLGQRGARIQFAGQKRTLEMELQDFARNVSGASDALSVFEQRLLGNGQVSPSTGSTNSSNSSSTGSSNSFASKTKDIANRLGIDPHALMTIMLFESAGTLNPKKQGPEVKNKKGVSQGRGRGLIQFMPATARGLGTSDSALAAMSDVEQLDWVEKYFAQFKGDFGEGKLENLYAAVLAGDPLKVNASDGYTTARKGAVTMMRDFGKKATQLLGNVTAPETRLSVPSLPTVGFSVGSFPPKTRPAFNNSSGALPAPPDMGQATQDTEFLISKEEQKLDLQDSLINNQEKESLDIAIANTFKSIARQVAQEIKERQFQMDEFDNSRIDLLANYDYQTAETGASASIRSVNQAFVTRWRDTTKQIQFYADEIDSSQKIIADTPSLVAQAKTDEGRQILYEQQANAQLLLPVYQDNLKQLTEQLLGLRLSAEKALKFVREQNKLKIEQEKLTKENTILEQKANLARERGTLEERRQLKIKQEENRLKLAISQIKEKYPKGKQRGQEIEGEQRQSKVNKENINYDSQLEELDIERKLLDYQSGIGDKKAGFMSRFALNFGAEKLKKDNAIAQEKLRFERELVELEKQYKGEPEKLNRLTQAARELNSVNLLSIEKEFKSLGKTVEDYFGSATQGFFTQFTTNLYDGKAQSDRALLEERLRYAEEVVGLENSNRDTPGKLAHLKNRARELNEEKLDKIRGEFNLFSRVIDLARGALLEFVKQLALLAAQQAASKFISSILGSLLNAGAGAAVGSPAKVGNDYGSGAGTFTASEGITVGEIKSRKLTPRVTNLLRGNYPGVAQAWRAEGEGAQLGVFHTGEELLSRKTGEAGRYQALKYKLGINPLAKIPNYAGGGTIQSAGANALSGFSASRPRIDLSGLNNRGTAEGVRASKTINIKTTVVTPNADSFRLNQDQMNQDLIERLRRGIETLIDG
ncbi:MAG: hypothetical protein RLZZ535_3458, partial [Cyanobacteriota bacterium]